MDPGCLEGNDREADVHDEFMLRVLLRIVQVKFIAVASFGSPQAVFADEPAQGRPCRPKFLHADFESPHGILSAGDGVKADFPVRLYLLRND